MINEKDFLELCKTKGIEPFKVLTNLDEETDIILKSEDIYDFFKMCECYNAKCIFYSYAQQIGEAADFNRETLIDYIKQQIDIEEIKDYCDPFCFSDEDVDFDSLIEKYSLRINQILEIQKESLGSTMYEEPLMLEVFISCGGDRIGMTIINNELLTQTRGKSSLIEELKQNIEDDIKSFYEQISQKKAEMYEKEQEERENRYNKAIDEIKEALQKSEKLLDCTNGKLRHAYARDLANEYSEKFNCHITISEVEIFVEEEYKKNKKYIYRK